VIYVEGFVIAVPAANRAAYLSHAAKVAPLFRQLGASRMVETWADEVPDGKVTDFKGAVKAKEGEQVVFSWFEYPSRQARDAANQQMMNDPHMKEMGASMPFDGQRMIFAGFAAIVEEGAKGNLGYVDGFVVPVPTSNKEAYRQIASRNAGVFRAYGANRVVEAWGDDVPDGKVTDFKRAVLATADESVVYSWVEWPSKAQRDAAWKKVMTDERMKPAQTNPPFDGKRLIYGGFSPILEV
jgi:uncharacterized protein YbaA (DUF1428 family)